MGYSEALEQQLLLLNYMERTRDFAPHARPLSASSERWILDRISEAEPYYWSAPIASIVHETSLTMPDWVLRPEDLPSRSGFFWFSNPVRIRGHVEHRPADLASVYWSADATAAYFGLQLVHPDRPAGLPIASGLWQFGESIGAATGNTPADDAERASYALFLIGACFAFIAQRILVPSVRLAERHARKRIERLGFNHEPLVRVVEMRRRSSTTSRDSDRESVEWSHQWVVQGHWRQQPYPSLGIVQPRWIMPYVKGPEDKPLSPPRAKVFAVVR